MLRSILAFILITPIAAIVGCVALFVPFPGNESLSELAGMLLFISIFAVPFVAGGALIFGLPALMIARKHGFTSSLAHCAAIGAMTGGVASVVVVGIALNGQQLGWLFVSGAASGLSAGALWWTFVERQRISNG